MTIPAHTKTWQFQVNQLFGPPASVLAGARSVMYAIKQSFVGSGTWTDSNGNTVASSGNWTVTSSCNGANGTPSPNTFGNNDNVDHWLSLTDLTWAAAASNHSWIVLQQTGIAAKFQVCIDLSQSAGSEYNCTVVYSPSAGFGAANGGANGSATARPTATDEKVLINATTWGMSSALTSGTALHVLKTSDGYSSRVILTRDNVIQGYWAFEVPNNFVGTGTWTSPSIAAATGGSSSGNSAGANPAQSYFLGSSNWWARAGATQFSMISPAMGNSFDGAPMTYLTYANEIDDAFPFLPVGLYSTTVGARGMNGVVYDCFYAFNVMPTGMTFPQATIVSDTNARQWLVIGPFIQPWNKSIPKLRV